MIGTVRAWNASKGFGFIDPDDGGTNIFVTRREVRRAHIEGFDRGKRVQFEVEHTDKNPVARDLRDIRDVGETDGAALMTEVFGTTKPKRKLIR